MQPRIGIEASGGYERTIVAKLRMEGFEVIAFQPNQVAPMPCFACKGPRTISLMALSSPLAPLRSKPATLKDSRFATLAEHLTFIEQIEEDIARGNTRREGYQTPEIEAEIEAEISRLKKRRAVELKRLLAILCPPHRKGISDASPMPISPTRSFPMESSLGRIVWPPENHRQTHKLALVACARKLLIFANTPLSRETPWTPKKPVKITSERINGPAPT
jgi:hypothetical protein